MWWGCTAYTLMRTSTCTLSWTEWQIILQKVKHNQFYSKWDYLSFLQYQDVCFSPIFPFFELPTPPPLLLSLIPSPLLSPSPIFPSHPYPSPFLRIEKNNRCRNQPFQLVLDVWSSPLFLELLCVPLHVKELIINPVVLLKVAWNKRVVSMERDPQ